MIKKFIYIILLILVNDLHSEPYSLKESYLIEQEISGTDNRSIDKGITEALISLSIKLTGDSQIFNKRTFKEILVNKTNFLTEYRLFQREERFYGEFSFSGNNIRAAFANNGFPIIINQVNEILVYLPCRKPTSLSIEQKETFNAICESSYFLLKDLMKQRGFLAIEPIMDAKELAKMELIESLDIQRFIRTINRRYQIKDWVSCSAFDDFGLPNKEVQCISSRQKDKQKYKQTINELINLINLDNQLVLDQESSSKFYLTVRGIDSYVILSNMMKEIKSFVLIKELQLKSINKDAAILFVEVHGSKFEFERLLNIDLSFEKLNDDNSTASLLYNYQKVTFN
tara:strand:+ start:78542 stop:79567 length:1026 start_codon:yes stop_codon:yes gene_type:complete